MLKNLIGLNKCTGCAACKQVCPNGAIKLEVSENEYCGLVSFYDTEKCVGCNKCREVCPVCNKPESNNTKEPDCYAVIASDKIRSNSTSGGAFTLLAKEIFSMGGAVCGVSFDKDLHAHHIIIRKEEDLDLLRHSKYVQADCQEIYQDIEKAAAEGPILIVGTPCQIAGMKKYFSMPMHNMNSDSLIFADLYCDHAPGALTFVNYLKDSFNIIDIKRYTFRTKQRGWVADAATVLFDNGHVKTLDNSNDYYQQAYHAHLTTRKVCEHCEFAGNPRQGDLTIADYWWINESNPELDDHFGTSCVLVNNDKGRELFNRIIESTNNYVDGTSEDGETQEESETGQKNGKVNPDIKIIKKLPFSTMKKNRPVEFPANPARDRFYKIQGTYGFNEAVRRCLHPYFDVVLWGNWSEKNYGSELTYYALYNVLNDMGKEVLLVERPKTASWGPNDKAVLFKNVPYPSYYTYVPESKTDMRRINDWSDTFMVGSDQIWHHDLYEPFGRVAYLDYIYPSKKKIAYASSFGREYWRGTDYERQETAMMLQEFDAVSVREKSGTDLCKELFNCNAEYVLDPIFLCDREKLRGLAKTAEQHEHFIGVYMLDITPEKLSVIRAVEQKTGLPVRLITDAFHSYSLDKDVLNFSSNEELIGDSSEEEWIENFVDADYVVTDSFHGTCLSIIFGKQFISISNEERGSIRFVDLLSQFGITERLIDEYDIRPEAVKKIVDEDIDYETVNKILESRKQFSMDWLTNALEKKKDVQVSEEELRRHQVDELEYHIEQVQKENQKILDWHTGRLDHHDDIQQWHTDRLDYHDKIQKWHTERLDTDEWTQNSNASKMDHINQMAKLHMERLEGQERRIDNLSQIEKLHMERIEGYEDILTEQAEQLKAQEEKIDYQYNIQEWHTKWLQGLDKNKYDRREGLKGILKDTWRKHFGKGTRY